MTNNTKKLLNERQLTAPQSCCGKQCDIIYRVRLTRSPCNYVHIWFVEINSQNGSIIVTKKYFRRYITTIRLKIHSILSKIYLLYND